MAAAMARQYSGQRFRSGRFRGRQGSGEDAVQLDFTKDTLENVKEILSYVVKQNAFSKAKKLSYLNVFVKLVDKCGDTTKLGLPLTHILKCISVNLLHAPKEVRAASLRVLKHLVCDDESLQAMLDLHIDYFIARSLDMCLDNEIERIHAQKLVRRIIQVTPGVLPKSLVYPLVAIGSDGAVERDRMVRISLASVCEIAYCNPDLLAHCGGISMLLRKVLDCHQFPRINESLVCTILHLLNHPKTRHFIRFNTDLEQLLAPFTDCHFSYSADEADHHSEDKERRFTASKMAIITVMRSWPGIIRFCRPDGTGLQSLVGILYLPFMDIRQGILEIVYDLFHLTLPVWTSDFTEALVSTDPSEMVEEWQLTDGFVASEGKALLPHMAKIRPNLVQNHLALLLAAWIGAGILDALVEVIISTQDELFIRAVILLGELLHLGNRLLPPECNHHSHYLPSLMTLASSFNIPNRERHQASVAVSYLNRIHSLKKRGPIPCSLYLDQVVKQSTSYKDKPVALNMQKDKLLDMHVRKRASSQEELTLQTIRDTQVLNTKDNKLWHWDLIGYALKWPDDKFKKLEDQSYIRFLKRLLYFYKPTNHLFSRMEYDHHLERKLAVCGCQLVDFMVRCDQEEGIRLLQDWLSDIALCLSEVALQRIAPESVLSAGNINYTLSHYYFLFLGRLSLTGRGDRYLEKAGIFQYLLDIVSSVSQDSYIKLIVSSLYYSREGNARTVLSKALCAATEMGRLYCTKFMLVLLRAEVQLFHNWGIELLVTQLYDQSRTIAITALTILDEASEKEANLESLVKMKPSFLHLGEKGVLILCRYMSSPGGFRFLTDANYTANELKKWHSSFNTRYVHIVEEQLNEALTTYEKTYEGSYTRKSSRKQRVNDVFVPIHLYGQLVQQKEGFQLLRQQAYVEDYFLCIHCQELRTDDDILQLKTALWAVGHISTSSWGIGWLEEEKAVPEVIRLAEECAVYSIRGTAFFILGLMASTREGAEVLTQYGWESRWNTHTEKWPVVEDRALLLEDSMEDVRMEVGFNFGGVRLDLGSPVSNLDFIAEEHFGLGNSGKIRSMTDGSVESIRDKDGDNESGIHILCQAKNTQSVSPDSRSFGRRMKGQTLPYDNQSRKFQTLPVRSQTLRSTSVSPNRLQQNRTNSMEHIHDKNTFGRLTSGDRSHSLKWEVLTKDPETRAASGSNSKLSEKSTPVIRSEKHVMIHEASDSSVAQNAINDDGTHSENETSVADQITETLTTSVTQLEKVQTNSNSLVENLDSAVSKHSSLKETHTDTTKTSSENNLGNTDLVLDHSIASDSNSLDTVSTVTPVLSSVVSETDVMPPPSVINTPSEHNQQISISVTDTDDPSSARTHTDTIQGALDSHSDTHKSQLQSVHSSQDDNVKCNRESSVTKPSALERTDSHDSGKKSVSLKDERSSSSDSSRTSKSRTDSFNTDSATSGVGSYDSGHHGVMEFPSLSPIVSTNSLERIDSKFHSQETKDSKEPFHPSVVLRRLSNLSRVPSARRKSSPGISFLPSSRFFDFSENAISYTTARDAIGYATLRSLKHRTVSSDIESDYGLNNLYDTGSLSSRRASIDSTNMEPFARPTSLHTGSLMRMNLSGTSLSEMESPSILTPRASLYRQRPHTGEAEFVGISLPVDIYMLFEHRSHEVHEGEDKRTSSFLGAGMSRQPSVLEQDDVQKSGRSDSGLEDLTAAYAQPALLAINQEHGSARSGRSPAPFVSADLTPTPMPSEHNMAICLQCQPLVTGESAPTQPDTTMERSADTPSFYLSQKSSQHKISISEQLAEHSGSQNSTPSDSSQSKKLSLDTAVGRTLVRKEIIRFVINLSSSVGVKGAEQGLLSLKQKFPAAFQDLCFYSEVCHLLATCSFRLTARRFIQELFEDIDMSKVLQEARAILGLDETADKPKLEKTFSGFDAFDEMFGS